MAAGLGSTVFSRLELDYYAQQNLTVRAIDPPCLRELGVAMRPAVKNNPWRARFCAPSAAPQQTTLPDGGAPSGAPRCFWGGMHL